MQMEEKKMTNLKVHVLKEKRMVVAAEEHRNPAANSSCGGLRIVS